MSQDPFSAPDQGAFFSPDQPVRRTKDGRPYVWDPSKGKEAPYTRVTTFIDCLEDKTMLAKWGERMALQGVRDDTSVGRRLMAVKPVPTLPSRPSGDEVRARNGLLDEEKKALNGIAADAKEAAGWKRAADLGTELHRLTEVVDGGGRLAPETPGVLAEDVAAYTGAMGRYGLRPVEAEVFVANDELRTAGTFDRVYEWSLPGREPIRVIGDLKTGRVDYGQGKLAMQLALYANSQRYDPARPTERGAVDVHPHVGLIVHLPVGKQECRVYALDLAQGWRGVVLAAQVRDWRRETSRGVLNDLALEVDLAAMLDER